MYTMRRTLMPRPRPEGDTKNFQFRMTVEETARWQEIFDRAWERTKGCIDATKFNRLLLGLEENPSILSEKDRLYFQQAGQDRAKVLGRAASSKPHIKEAAPQIKRK